MRNRQRIEDLPSFVVNATVDGRLYVFRDALPVANKNPSPGPPSPEDDTIAVADQVEASPGPPLPPEGDQEEGVDDADMDVYFSNSQGQRFYRRQGDMFVCIVCGKRKNSLPSIRNHVFRYACRENWSLRVKKRHPMLVR